MTSANWKCGVCGQELRPHQRHREADCAKRLAALETIRKENEAEGDRREYNNPRPKGDSDNARQW